MGTLFSRWNADEDAVIQQHYAKRGARYCLERLPGRTLNGVLSRAALLKVTKQAPKWQEPSALADATIRAAYLGLRPKGFVAKCARQLGWEPWQVSRRAGELNLLASRDPRPWSQEEQDFCDARPMVRPHELARQMKRRGWVRSAGAIASRRSHGGIEREDSERFTAAGLAQVMGVDTSIVVGWIRNGFLVADLRDGSPRDGFVIHERDVVAFVIAFPTRFALHKLELNKVWFMALLARYAAEPNRQDGQLPRRIRSVAQARPKASVEEIASIIGCEVNSVATVLRTARLKVISREAA